MTPMLAEIHRAHKARHQAWNAKAVPDDGIDFKQAPRNIILRSVVPPQITIKHVPPVMIVPIRRTHAPVALPKAPKPKPPSAFRLKYMAREIIDHLAKHFNVMPQQILGPDRHVIFIRPRFVAMYLCKSILRLSTPAIGRIFNGRDHSTAVHATRSARDRALSDFQFGSELAALECCIRKLIS